MRSVRSKISAVSVAALVFASAILAASPATAAYEELRPGAHSPLTVANTAWQPEPQVTRIAQPFVQPEAGRLASMSIGVFALPTGYEFGAAAIHAFEPGVGPSAEPIRGGSGGSVAYAPDPSIMPGVEHTPMWAEIEFPDRPELQAGAEYALVIDPTVGGGGSASFAAVVFATSTIQPWHEVDGVWSGYSTSYTIFDSRLATLFAETGSPTLATAECGVVPEVTLPASDGIEYTVERRDDTWSVTASALDGFELAPGAATSWTLPFEIEACGNVPIAPPTIPQSVETAAPAAPIAALP